MAGLNLLFQGYWLKRNKGVYCTDVANEKMNHTGWQQLLSSILPTNPGNHSEKKDLDSLKMAILLFCEEEKKKKKNKVIGWPARITHLYFKIKKIIYLIENTNLTSIAFIICS